jgi:hypothetical protein
MRFPHELTPKLIIPTSTLGHCRPVCAQPGAGMVAVIKPVFQPAHNRQPVQVIQTALDDLVLALGPDARRSDAQPSGTEHVDRQIIPRPNTAALAVVAIERVEFPRAGSDDDRASTMTV